MLLHYGLRNNILARCLIPITNLVRATSVIMDVRLLILRVRTLNISKKSIIASTDEMRISLIIHYQRIVKINETAEEAKLFY